ncbi:MAG: hypothetical protein JWQ49_4146 [Edaphobacter sp.]|nr:hypothetical protein [Edaphobacter sp.]
MHIYAYLQWLENAMSEKEIAFWTLIVTLVGLIAALAGVVFAIKTLKVAIQTVEESQRVARANFFVSVRALLANYDDVHAYLRPGGKWARVPIAGPANPREWARLELYMGTFEYCETLIHHRLLDLEEFRKSYGYRLELILANPIIVEAKLVDLLEGWRDFYNLCRTCGISLPAGVRAPKA